MILIRKAKPGDIWLQEPGVYRTAWNADKSQRSASVACPDCGRTASLSGHDIADDGTVTPSVVCPYEGCSFHDYVKLEGW